MFTIEVAFADIGALGKSHQRLLLLIQIMLFELTLREDEQIRLGLDGRLVNAKVRVEAQLTHVEQHVQPKANIEDAQEARE